MAKDYSYLEGKEFTYNTGVREISAKVLYADYYIGLTCVSSDDPTFYLICLPGPNAPNYPMIPRKVYQFIWSSFIKQIKHGCVHSRSSTKLLKKHLDKGATGTVTTLTSTDCAFGQ